MPQWSLKGVQLLRCTIFNTSLPAFTRYLPLIVQRVQFQNTTPSLSTKRTIDLETLIAIIENPEDCKQFVNLLDENGQSLGNVSLAQAKRTALQRDLRLAIVDDQPEASENFPTYRLSSCVPSKSNLKKTHKASQKLKEIRLNSTISKHDLNTKIALVKSMCQQNFNVKVVCAARGANSAEKALDIMKIVKNSLDDSTSVGEIQGSESHAVLHCKRKD